MNNMEQKNMEEKKKVQYDVSHCRVYVVDGAVIEIDKGGGRILFFNSPMLDVPDGSIACQCPGTILIKSWITYHITRLL
jgi:hypothetical protein